MLKLTKRAEYGLTALVHLTDHVGEVVSARAISEHYQLPHRLVGEALKDLCRAGHLLSVRGPAGGYRLAVPSTALTVGEAIAAIEGAPSLADCDVESRCPIRSPLHRIQEDIWRQFERTTLAELAAPEFSLLPRAGSQRPPSPISA
jgi:Rrf2 family nitric oxide-sensitive transcriptional repressor